MNSLALLNRHRLKPGEKQLAIYGSRNPWPGGIADFLEQLCLEPQAHSVGRSFSRRVKIQFGSHSCRSSHRVVEQAPALRLRQKLIILESRAVGLIENWQNRRREIYSGNRLPPGGHKARVILIRLNHGRFQRVALRNHDSAYRE